MPECPCRIVNESSSYGTGFRLTWEYCPLHAAAPELLEALKRVLDSVINERGPAIKAARTAIAKAEGRDA